MSINAEKIKNDFLELSAIDALSFKEREMADVLTKRLEELGLIVQEDNAGEKIGGNAGNLYGYLKGTLHGDPILFSAHMDTVTPGLGKKAIVDGDKITSDGTTVLGSDDLAGVIPILRGIEMAIESGKPMRDVEVLFSVAEEVYVKGARAFDYSQIRSKDVYVLDMSGPVGRAAVKAPSIVQFKATLTGRAAHAGFEPENGLHAIEAMGLAVSKIKNGHLDDDSTFNIGKIQGGLATNIVPESCTIEGEARSFVHEKAMKHIDGARGILDEVAKSKGMELDFEVFVGTEAFETSNESTVYERYAKACKNLGIEAEYTKTFGGSDNNFFAKKGMKGIVISTGAGNVHSTKEYCYISQMLKNAEIIKEMLIIE